MTPLHGEGGANLKGKTGSGITCVHYTQCPGLSDSVDSVLASLVKSGFSPDSAVSFRNVPWLQIESQGLT